MVNGTDILENCKSCMNMRHESQQANINTHKEKKKTKQNKKQSHSREVSPPIESYAVRSWEIKTIEHSIKIQVGIT